MIGTVTLTDTAAGVDFSLSPSAGYLINLAGNGHTTFSFSTNVTLTPASFTNLTAGFVPVLPNLNQNGFGDFTAGVTDNGSIGNTFAGPLTFTVLGIDFSNFTQSANDAEFSVLRCRFLRTGKWQHWACRQRPSRSDAVQENPPGSTPIPSAVWLFAGALGLLGMLSRRKKHQSHLAWSKY